MFSVMNCMRRNCAGVVLRTLNTQNSLIGNKCLPPLLQKENLLLAAASSNWSPYLLSNKKGLPSSKHMSRAMSVDHSHSKIWTMERFLSAGLIGILPMALAYPNPAFDYALALALTVHVHWGIEAIVVDYVRPTVVGATLSRAALAGVYALSVLTLGGLFYFNYSDVGLSHAIRMLWKL